MAVVGNEITDHETTNDDDDIHPAIKMAHQYHSRFCMNSRRSPKPLARLMKLADITVNTRSLEGEHLILNHPKFLTKSYSHMIINNNNNNTNSSNRTVMIIDRVIYVRNQKVATTTLYETAKSYSGVRNGIHKRYAYEWIDNNMKKNGPMFSICESNDFYFTFIRDPISCFISGWIEILYRAKYSSKHIHAAPSLSMPSNTNASLLFSSFLKDIEENKYLGTESFHIWPQAVKIDSVPKGCKYRFIGQFSSFNQDLETLFPESHYSKINIQQVKRAFPHILSFKNNILNTLTYGKEEIRKICKFLKSDYDCFGFEIPSDCQDIL